MKFLTENKNLLLKRNDVTFILEQSSAPSMAEAVQALTDDGKDVAEAIVVRSIRNAYGSHSFTVEASIYESPEMRTKVERKKREKKTGGAS